MYKPALILFTLLACSLALPEPVIEERHIIEVEKRQADVSQLLQLASLAGITALPTDPAVLLSLGPLANSLAAALPTPSVLSVLMTAAPSGFVSSIVNDPSYASSFQYAFSVGSSPSWFNALPTDVKSYLHTYSGFGGVAGAAGAVKGAATGASQLNSAQQTESGTSAASDSAAPGSNASRMSGASAMTTSGASAGSTATRTQTTTASSGASGAGSTATSAVAGAGNSATSAAGGVASSASSGGDAPRPTGVIPAGIMGAVGVFGVAAML
ncbi:MAG: hypothetical protein Q9217_006100 [Psora testacea]